MDDRELPAPPWGPHRRLPVCATSASGDPGTRKARGRLHRSTRPDRPRGPPGRPGRRRPLAAPRGACTNCYLVEERSWESNWTHRLLGREEGVEAPDDVRCYRLHPPGAVEHEVDVHGRAVSFMAVSLSWDSSSPRTHARAPSGWCRSSPGLRRCPTSARRRINSSESRGLMRWLVLARGAREPDEK